MESQEERDEWLEQVDNLLKGSLFDCLRVSFDDRTIAAAEEECCSQPMPHFDGMDEEALYNPLQDDEDDRFMKNRGLAQTCPSCFRQVAYAGQPDQVYGVVVREDQIIRTPFASERMPSLLQLSPEKQAEALQARQLEINIKIICECKCGITLGYYDVNQQKYVLTEVI